MEGQNISSIQECAHYIPSPDSKLSSICDSLIYIPSPSPKENGSGTNESQNFGLQDSMYFIPSPSSIQDSVHYIPSPDSKLSSIRDSLIYIPSPSPKENGSGTNESQNLGLQDSMYFIPSPSPNKNRVQRSLQFMFEYEPPALSPSLLNPRKRHFSSVEDAQYYIESPQCSKYMRITSTPKPFRKRLAFSPSDVPETISENAFLEELHSDHNESINSNISELGEVHPTPHKTLRRLKRLLNSKQNGKLIIIAQFTLVLLCKKFYCCV